MIKKIKSKSKQIVICIIAVALLVACIVWQRRGQPNTPQPTPTVQPTPALTTTYVTGVQWPPIVREFAGAFSCEGGGNIISQMGSTTKKDINGKTYCVMEASEGAAGSTYTTYTYATTGTAGMLLQTSFTLRFVQCENYDDPQKTACKAEQKNFGIDGIMSTIFNNYLAKAVQS